MAAKNWAQAQIWTNADLSQTTLTSAYTDTKTLDNVCYELVAALTAEVTVTFSAGSAETDTVTINGFATTIAGTGVAATDAAAMIKAINANGNLQNVVVATQGSTTAKVFIQSLATGTGGNAYTATKSGTNMAITGGGTFVAGTAPTGSFDLQCSLDYTTTLSGIETLNPGHWVSVPLSATPSLSGASSNIMIAVNQIPGRWLRLVYTSVSGAGLVNGYISAKGI